MGVGGRKRGEELYNKGGPHRGPFMPSSLPIFYFFIFYFFGDL
jgi:hypothetical protein